MKNTAIFTIAILAVSGAAAYAEPYGSNSYIARARVIESAPIIETVYEQREVCGYEYVDERHSGSGSVEDKIIGGVLGGAAGSAFGKGSGRDAAAGVGALLGSEVAAQDGQLTGGELIGGIAGGVIGNQVGKGSGKTAATAAGVLLGSIIGGNLENGGATAHADGARKKVRVCEKKEFPKRVVTGYDVVFEHDGYRFSSITAREPGNYVDVGVSVEILEEYTSSR